MVAFRLLRGDLPTRRRPRNAAIMSSIESPGFLDASGSSPPIPTISTLDAALDYTRQGFRVVPLQPRLKRPWQRPAGYQKRPDPTEPEIRQWFAAEPDLNIGILTGNGIIVLDIDEHDGKASGSEALASLEAIYGQLPKTLTSITGSGGRHLIFFLPDGDDGKNTLAVVSDWLRSTTGNATGGVIDVKRDGSLIAVAPSIHPNGNLYRWEDPDAEIAELPLTWCQTPPEDPERRTRKRKPASHLAPKDLDRRDAIAHERMANVDADTLLGKDTLLLLEAEVEDGTDRSHRMYQIILGAASSRFDMDRLYDRMVNSPLKEGLREHGGREWFDQDVLEAHQHLAENILAVEEIRAEEYEWTSTQIDTGRKVSGEVMQQVFEEVLDIAVQRATLEPICDKHKIADATGLNRLTVIRAFKGLAVLGRLEAVHEPGKPSDCPWKYRLLPDATSVAAAPVSPSCVSSPPTPGHSPTSRIPSTPLSLLPVSRSNQEWVASEGSKDLLGESRDTPRPPTGENADEILLNFEDAPEPARTKKKIDPWAAHACRKCGQPTLSMRDPDTDPDRVFRVDAQPSPTGNYVVVDDRWKVLQGEGRTNHERAHDDTDRQYYAWHNCQPTTPPQSVPQPPQSPPDPVDALQSVETLTAPLGTPLCHSSQAS